MVCRHCQKVPARRPRGLCWSCYYKPGVRELYAPFCDPHHGSDFFGRERLASEPTRALPGSPEKVAVLEARARSRVSLWHPLDAR